MCSGVVSGSPYLLSMRPLSLDEVHDRALAERSQHDGFRVRVNSTAALITRGIEELEVVSVRAGGGHLVDLRGDLVRPADVVALRSGRRLTFRRVLETDGERVFVRGDIVPFADGWLAPNRDRDRAPRDGVVSVVGRVRPRAIDRFARIDPSRFVRGSWAAAVAAAHARSVALRAVAIAFGATSRPDFEVRLMSPSEWPLVASFWRRVRAERSPATAPKGAHVVGLFDRSRLVGVNIQLVTGEESYSAYTIVDPNYRGMGGSRLLLDESLRIVDKLGLRRVYVHIHALNLPSLAAYQRAGFRFDRWWEDASDPMLSAEYQWRVYERAL